MDRGNQDISSLMHCRDLPLSLTVAPIGDAQSVRIQTALVLR